MTLFGAPRSLSGAANDPRMTLSKRDIDCQNLPSRDTGDRECL